MHDAAGSDVVVVRGYTIAAESGGVKTRRAIRDALVALPSASPPIAVDQLVLCAPRAHPLAQSHPLFRRIYFVPALLSRGVTRYPTLSTPGPLAIRLGLWAAIASAALRIVAVQPTTIPVTRAVCRAAASTLLLLSCARMAAGVQLGILVGNVLTSFEFWYVAANLVGGHICAALGSTQTDPTLRTVDFATELADFVSAVVGFLFLDAVDLPRGVRGVRYGVLALLCLVDAVGWSVIQPNRGVALDLLVFQSTLGATAVSCFATVIAFMLKLCVDTADLRNAAPMQPLPPGSAIGLGEDGSRKEPAPAPVAPQGTA